MGDHFVLLVDRLLTESTLEAAIESRKVLQIGQGATSASIDDVIEIPFQKRNFIDGSLSSRKLVECRICQDEDEDSSMEAPCSCSGSLKVCYPSDFDDSSFVEFHYFDALSNAMIGSSSSI